MRLPCRRCRPSISWARGLCIGAGCLAAWCWRCPAVILLVILNSRWLARKAEDAPVIYRPRVDPLAREFVYFFAIVPVLLGSLVGGLFNLDRVAGGAGAALLMSGLAAVVATGDLIYLRRQRLLRSVWAGAIAAPA